MKSFAGKQQSKRNSPSKRICSSPVRTLPSPSPVLGVESSLIQRSDLCPCDGGCPRCTGMFQTKLSIGEPGDEYEQEADRVAEQVISTPDGSLQRQPMEEEELMAKPMDGMITHFLQRQPLEEEEEMLQPKAGEGTLVPGIQRQPIEEEEEELMAKTNEGTTPALHQRHPDIRGEMGNSKGAPLPRRTRSYMENGFGVGFEEIRIHTDTRAIQLSGRLNAQAFTMGKDIYFNRGNFNPGSTAGKRLLAHELTHVVQQGAVQRKMIQRDNDDQAPAQTATEPAQAESPTPGPDEFSQLISDIIRDQLLSNAGLRTHLSTLGGTLQELALSSSTGPGDQPATSAERFSALGITRAFETAATAILNDPALSQLRERIADVVGDNPGVALAAVLSGALVAYLADIDISGSPTVDLGQGFSIGGSFAFGTVQAPVFENLQLYAQYANEQFRTRITGRVARDEESEQLVGTGTGQIRLGNDLSSLTATLRIDSEGQISVVGRLSTGHEFGEGNRLVFTTDVSHSFPGDETIFSPGVSGRIRLGASQHLRIGASMDVSTDEGLTGFTGYLEYQQDSIRLRIEGNMSGLPEDTGIQPGGNMLIQGTLTIPF